MNTLHSGIKLPPIMHIRLINESLNWDVLCLLHIIMVININCGNGLSQKCENGSIDTFQKIPYTVTKSHNF